MTKSTYTMLWMLNPHMGTEEPYPHKDSITFIVMTGHAPKSTYSPPLTESLLIWSDEYVQHVVDEMIEESMAKWEILQE
jgi:hypothetical protein